MENFRKAFGAVTWSLERIQETMNHLGLAWVIAGWLQALVTDVQINWLISMIGLALIVLSIMRHPKWTTSP